MEQSPHILIVTSRFYPDIADELIRGAVKVLEHADATFEQWEVPGVFELPMAISLSLRTKSWFGLCPRFNGFVLLGCVIRGETSHYDHICSAVMHSLQHLVIEHRLALGNGILTVENHQQAWARASIHDKNRGDVAARTCLDMVALKQHQALYFHL